ncbi:SDR family NAD(P)-dependent oxidoreductase [Streptomyces nondiastaticus]|uniref:SDR family NAD(P)-dependent oxidoreductase n=1 Tax=Streptomyces nondiastaticus TaxID=3154512 RepID=A0ABW6U3H2_9ACTN
MSDRCAAPSVPSPPSVPSVPSDAIAVVGVACRLPGGIRDLGGLWDALAAGRDLVTAAPPDGRFDVRRFLDPDPAFPGKSYTFAGGYLDNVTDFDAEYFGISPREAQRMDPQQRLLLEMTAEAFDDAGIDPAGLAGSDTAVLVGVADTSYGVLQMLRSEDIDPHTMTGGAASIAANRLSYAFDLRGPSMAVDTACSSSLVAVHQACEGLRAGHSRVAVAGGVSLLISPQAYVGFSRASMLSPRGRCAAFSAAADGYVRSEGGGVVLLKRLSDALADGDRVQAVIAASGTNTDGGTPHLPVPSAEMQRRLLTDVHARAGAGADDLVYFEAHGTGTPVGDPLECLAVGQAVAARRSSGPLPIGSVKSNLGHSEPASGMAGLFKAMLVLRHGLIPATLHSVPLNPAIDFRGLNLEPVGAMRPVARREGLGGGFGGGFVGVNSFGFGGANAHVVLAGAPAPIPPASTAPPVPPVPPVPPGRVRQGLLPLVISARSREALAETARAVAERLAAVAAEVFYDLCWTACRRRARHPYRVAVLAATPEDAARQLRELVQDEGELRAPEGAVSGGRVAFVFSGNGSQWPGMAADLMAGEPVFRAAVEEVDAHLAPRLGWSVAGLLAAGAQGAGLVSRMADTRYAQPALFAVQSGLVALLAHYGVRPQAVVGHSVGEVAAAYVCGALDLPAAARVVAERSLAQAATAGKGRMAAAALTPREAEKEIAPYAGLLEIGAVNSGRDVTVSGDHRSLRELGERLAGRGIPFRELDVDHAFHSSAMDGIEEPLRDALAGLSSAGPRVPMYSTVTARRVRRGQLGAGYWWDNVRRPVRFDEAVRRMAEDGGGLGAVVEIGPQPSLRGPLSRIAAEYGGKAFPVVPTLGRECGGVAAVRRAVARLAAADVGTDWGRWFPRPGRVVDLPAYAWQRKRHWFGTPEHWIRTSGDGIVVHPLLGERAPVLEPTWHTTLERTRCPWLAGHRVGGAAVMPAAAYLEMALAAGREVFGDAVELDCVDISRMLPLDWDAKGIRLQTSLSDEDGVFRVASRAGDTDGWRLHARGRARRLAGAAPPGLDAARARERTARVVTGSEHYAAAERRGLGYGPAFRVLRDLRVGDREVLAGYRHEEPEEGYDARGGYGGYVVHPALLDGALQAGILLLPGTTDTYLPAAVGRLRMWRTPDPAGLVHVRERSRTPHEVVCDITVTDAGGRVSAELEGCRLHRSALHDDLPQEYATVMRAAALPGRRTPPASAPPPPPPPPPPAVLAAARPEIGTVLKAWDGRQHAQCMDALARAAAHSAAEAFAAILPERAPVAFSFDDLAAAGVLPGYRSYVGMLARMAQRYGLLEEPESQESGRRGWVLRRLGDFKGALREVLREHPAYPATAALHGRGGLHLADVLTGRRDPAELLFQDSGPPLMRQLRDTEPACAVQYRIAAAVVRAFVRTAPEDGPLRVLEVGAGGGGLTARLLPLFPPERTEYVYADVSRAHFSMAQERFAAYDFVDYRTFDLDLDPGHDHNHNGNDPAGFAQVMPAESFDLIVAGHSLHAARDVAAGVRRLARLLAPGGSLLAVEAHDPEAFALGAAMLPGFWRTEGTGPQSGSVLLSRAQWSAVFEENGFGAPAQAVPARGPAGDDFSVFLARRDTSLPRENTHRDASLPLENSSAPTGRQDQENQENPSADWLVITEDGSEPDLITSLAGQLTGDPGSVRTVTAGEVHKVLHDTGPTGVRAVLVLSEEQDRAVPEDPGAAVDLAVRRVATLRELARACSGHGRSALRQLTLVTHPTGALPSPERAACPGQAAAWGAARTLANEVTHVSVRRVSLERGAQPEQDACRLAEELLAEAPGEDEVALTRGGRFVPRVVRASAPVVPSSARTGSSYRLSVEGLGLGYRLQWDEAPVPRPDTGEVVVGVRAAALNYRDVMVVTGLLPAVAEDGVASERLLGLECAGVVTAVGPGVRGLSVGDRVFGTAAGAFAGHVRARASMVRRIPGRLAFTEAVTLPTVFLTVQHSLEHLARLHRGEVLLVHGGAGGVGLAALQYARRVGARVVATAGSPAKRDLLRVLGVDHVLDSRGADFADRVRQLTGGHGADVVLNSLSGQGMARGMEVLARGGRFVELGKQDVYANRRALLRPLAGNTSFFVVDVAQVTASGSGAASAAFGTVARRAERGEYRPLPHHVFPAHRIDEAFHLMQHSRHIGKVVVSFGEPVPVRPACEQQQRMDPEGTYLVTGGLSGLGASTALWLAERGARHLALTGRRGGATPGAAALLARLAAQGVSADAYGVDVTDAGAMEALVRDLDAGGRPLRGVVHAAMHLEDDKLTGLDDERIRAVLAPKLGGALVLDRLTRGRGAGFLAYSSMNVWAGSIQQAGYSAGNLFLEALARVRLRAGEPARAVAWGAIGDTGYAARHGLNPALAKAGLRPVAPGEACAALDTFHSWGTEVAGFGRCDWARMAMIMPSLTAPRFRQVMPPGAADADHRSDELLVQLAATRPEEAADRLEQAVATVTAGILHLPVESLDRARPLQEYGLDSLMNMELLAKLRGRFPCELAAMDLLHSDGSIRSIGTTLLRRLAEAPVEQPLPVPRPRG